MDDFDFEKVLINRITTIKNDIEEYERKLAKKPCGVQLRRKRSLETMLEINYKILMHVTGSPSIDDIPH